MEEQGSARPGLFRDDLLKWSTFMRGVVMHAQMCVCGSDLWPYRGIEKLDGPTPMGHEYVGVVEQVGD